LREIRLLGKFRSRQCEIKETMRRKKTQEVKQGIDKAERSLKNIENGLDNMEKTVKLSQKSNRR